MQYFKLSLKPALEGVGLAIFLLLIYFILIGFIFKHRFMKFQFSPYKCESSDLECKSKTIWDRISAEVPDNDITGLRKMRFGLLLIHCGLYLTFISTDLM